MNQKLYITNSLSRNKELFEPVNPPYVGMYVCGPTVSGESHLGHARPYVTFDVIYRYLLYLGYKVRYVRNITDAGHFEEEGREAVDKIATKAVLEKLEPMELVQKYTNLFHWAMLQFNCVEPSIEPTATGHIVEQIGMIEEIIRAGYAYEVNGSVYFDVKKYAASHDYGKLSGRIIDDLLCLDFLRYRAYWSRRLAQDGNALVWMPLQQSWLSFVELARPGDELMVYLTDSVGLAAGVVGTLIAVSKLFDGFTDIFFGSMIDKTHSKMGKAKPWMLYGYIGCAITLICCFTAPNCARVSLTSPRAPTSVLLYCATARS